MKRRDRGSTTVLSVALGALAVILVVTVGLVAQGFLTREKARTAADTAALAAADAARGLTSGEPCNVAKEVARANGAELTDCLASADQGKAVVTVRIRLPTALDRVVPKAKRYVKETAVAGRSGP